MERLESYEVCRLMAEEGSAEAPAGVDLRFRSLSRL